MRKISSLRCGDSMSFSGDSAQNQLPGNDASVSFDAFGAFAAAFDIPKRGFAAPAPEPEKAEPQDAVEDEPMEEQGTDLEDMDPSSISKKRQLQAVVSSDVCFVSGLKAKKQSEPKSPKICKITSREEDL